MRHNPFYVLGCLMKKGSRLQLTIPLVLARKQSEEPVHSLPEGPIILQPRLHPTTSQANRRIGGDPEQGSDPFQGRSTLSATQIDRHIPWLVPLPTPDPHKCFLVHPGVRISSCPDPAQSTAHQTFRRLPGRSMAGRAFSFVPSCRRTQGGGFWRKASPRYLPARARGSTRIT